MQIPLRRKLYGLNRAMAELRVILKHHYPEAYFRQTKTDHTRMERRIRRAIQTHVLGDQLLRAIAHDLLDSGIKTNSQTYLYLKNIVYHGNARALLGDLQDALHQDWQSTRRP